MADDFVLVVEDDPETLRMLHSALTLDGIRVRTASSVLRALEALHDGSPRPGAIVTDLMMPQTTGWDFLKHLRAEPALRSLPLIVITGGDPGESAALADVVLTKPIDTVKLAQTVRALMVPDSSPS